MKVRVKQNLVNMLDGDFEIKAGDELVVEHFAYGRFYRIKEPCELAEMTIEKDFFEVIP